MMVPAPGSVAAKLGAPNFGIALNSSGAVGSSQLSRFNGGQA